MLHHKLNHQINNWSEHSIVDIRVSVEKLKSEQKFTRHDIAEQHVHRTECFDRGVKFLLLMLHDGDDRVSRTNGLVQVLDCCTGCDSFAKFVWEKNRIC